MHTTLFLIPGINMFSSQQCFSHFDEPSFSGESCSDSSLLTGVQSMRLPSPNFFVSSLSDSSNGGCSISLGMGAGMSLGRRPRRCLHVSHSMPDGRRTRGPLGRRACARLIRSMGASADAVCPRSMGDAQNQFPNSVLSSNFSTSVKFVVTFEIH